MRRQRTRTFFFFGNNTETVETPRYVYSSGRRNDDVVVGQARSYHRCARGPATTSQWHLNSVRTECEFAVYARTATQTRCRARRVILFGYCAVCHGTVSRGMRDTGVRKYFYKTDCSVTRYYDNNSPQHGGVALSTCITTVRRGGGGRESLIFFRVSYKKKKFFFFKLRISICAALCI